MKKLKKLELKKEIISQIDEMQMNLIKGGINLRQTSVDPIDCPMSLGGHTCQESCIDCVTPTPAPEITDLVGCPATQQQEASCYLTCEPR